MRALDLGLSANRAAVIERATADATGAPSYRYPWDQLTADLTGQALCSFPCVGYGSLVNRTSAARTLRSRSQSLVVAFGVRRLFNYDLTADDPHYGPPANALARAALNVVVTGRSADIVNGVLFDVALDEIAALRDRETGYDLLPVACIEWQRRDADPFLAYILSCHSEEGGSGGATSPDIEPHRAYYRVCRDGAASLGDDFLRVWLETTFLADGITPMMDWESRQSPADTPAGEAARRP